VTPGAGRAQMFQIASGYPWPEALPVMDEDGDINGTTCLFFCTFTVVVIWVRPGPARGDSAAHSASVPRRQIAPGRDLRGNDLLAGVRGARAGCGPAILLRGPARLPSSVPPRATAGAGRGPRGKGERGGVHARAP
jgi:hypothetical protein